MTRMFVICCHCCSFAAQPRHQMRRPGVTTGNYPLDISKTDEKESRQSDQIGCLEEFGTVKHLGQVPEASRKFSNAESTPSTLSSE